MSIVSERVRILSVGGEWLTKQNLWSMRIISLKMNLSYQVLITTFYSD